MRGRRLLRCGGCGLPGGLCLCADVCPVKVSTRVVLLVHRTEAFKSTNTARLAARAVEGCELSIRGSGDRGDPGSGHRLVLFPTPESRRLTREDAAGEGPLTLIVPDGTWAQARRILRRDAWARGAPVVSLGEDGYSRYGLRRNVRPGGLSTFEAVARALAILEGDDVERSLLPLLDLFVARVHEARRHGTRYAEITSP